MNLKAWLRPHRSVRTPGTSTEHQAALSFSWPTTETKELLPGLPTDWGWFPCNSAETLSHTCSTKIPTSFLSFWLQRLCFMLGFPRNYSWGQDFKCQFFIWEVIQEASVGEREGKWKWKATNKRCVIELVTAVGKWSSMLLGNSRRQDGTYLGVLPDKVLGKWGICSPTHTSHCGGLLERRGSMGKLTPWDILPAPSANEVGAYSQRKPAGKAHRCVYLKAGRSSVVSRNTDNPVWSPRNA